MSQMNIEEESYYWNLWLTEKDAEAANYLVKLYEPIITYQVKRMRVSVPKNITTDELMSYAYSGLYDALLKFDSKRDLKFDTYASIRVKGAIIDGLRRDDPLPRSLRAKAKKIEAVIEELEQKYQRDVTLAEVAKEMDMSIEDVRTILNDSYSGNMVSIDDAIDATNGTESVGSIIEDKHAVNPIGALVREENIDIIAQYIAALSEKEQIIISLFYHEELTLSEIGRILELSTSRVSQIHSKALKKLRERLKVEAFPSNGV